MSDKYHTQFARQLFEVEARNNSAVCDRAIKCAGWEKNPARNRSNSALIAAKKERGGDK